MENRLKWYELVGIVLIIMFVVIVSHFLAEFLINDFVAWLDN